ncbi:MSCRAMM family protein, partial [Enterococcus casseliflavus]
NETGKTSNTWSAASDDFLQYDLTTSAVEKLGSRFLPNISIEDQVDFSKVSISTVQVLAQGIDVTSQFTVTQNTAENKVTAVAKDSALSTSSFYGKAYTLRTKMKLLSSVIDAKEKQTITITKNGLVKAGSLTATSNAVTTTLPAYKLTVNHVTETEKALLKQVVETKYDGESYEYKPLDDLFDVKGNRYRSKVTRSGVVAGKDLVLEIPYYLPSLEINAEKVSILTGKASLTDNLKATITFSKSASYEEELKNVLYRLTVTDQKQKKTVFTKDISLGSYASSLAVDLPTAGFTKSEKVPYSLSLQVLKNPDKVKAETDTIDFSTFGYTASEKVLTNADLKSGKLSYGAVSQTEATRKTKAYVEKKETLQFDFEAQRSSKTGYGLPITLEPIYSSEIQDTPLLSFTLSSPTKLVDTYLDLQYVESKGNIQIPLDRTVNQVAKQTTAAITSTKFEFPQISVEEKTGALYTQEQV